MAKILIVYDSRTGNTQKMALAVADGVKQVKGVEVVVKNVDEANTEDLLGADGIIVGSPTYCGLMSGKIKTFVDKSAVIGEKLDGKVGAAFTSSSGTAGGAETTLLSILEVMLVAGMIIQGRQENKHYGAAAVGKPKEEEIKICESLGKRTAELVLKVSPRIN
jgi:NAD(P)H dehydrogenase (quinone)